jgi:GntR family transcriptional regulator
MTENSPIFSPLYQQIKVLLLQSLSNGEWNAGDMIPSEVELAARYKVSQGTVRKAIDELAAENLLVRRQGRGTFVATHQEAKIRFRFLSMQANSGKEFKTSSRILNVETIVAPDGVRESLALKKKDKVVQIMRLLSFNDDAAVFEQIYLPFEIFTDVTAAKLTNYKGTLYGWFEAEYNVRMIRAVEKIRAVNAPEQATELLGIDEKQALLFVERISYTYADKPVEVRHGWYLTQDYFYQNELI